MSMNNKKLLLSLLLALLFTVPTFAASGTDNLVVSCIDYRLRTDVENAMVHMFGANGYDEVALPGAGLGILNDQFKAWNTTFTESLDVAIQLHGVKNVVFVDHEDCGAYKTILKSDDLATHQAQMKKVRAFMKSKYPALQVQTYLMELSGHLKGLGDTKDPPNQAH